MPRCLFVLIACASFGLAQPIPLEGIAHIGYRVADLDKADAYYTGVLGLSRAFRTGDGAAFYKVSDDQYVELRTGESALPAFHVALQTTSIEGLRKSVERGSMLGTPSYRWIGAKQRLGTEYTVFVSEIREGFSGVKDVRIEDGFLIVLPR